MLYLQRCSSLAVMMVIWVFVALQSAWRSLAVRFDINEAFLPRDLLASRHFPTFGPFCESELPDINAASCCYMIGYDCHALQRSSTGILNEGINECIQLFILQLQLLFPVIKSIVNISGFYNMWKLWHTWFSILITRLTVNRVKWRSNTYSRSVDAKFSGQNEKRSSQHVDVHLRMRQHRMSKRCYSADVKYLALPGKVYLMSPGAIKSIQSHLKNYSRVRLSTLSGYETRPLHHRQDKCSGYIIDLKVAEHYASLCLIWTHL